jgi:hypothetical protein
MKEIIPSFASYLICELSENSTLYHRSPIKLKVGDTIMPKKDKDGSHWLQSKVSEIALEELRKREYQDRPSRFTCIYATAHPRSRFVDKGYLYAIKPIGKVFMTDSNLIDKIDNDFDRNLENEYSDWDYKLDFIKKVKAGDKNALSELRYYLSYEADAYWRGTQRGDIKTLEILCESAIVTEEINEAKRLRVNDDVTIDSEGLSARIQIWINSKHNCKRIFSDDEAKELIAKFKSDVFINSSVLKETIKPGEGKDGNTEYYLEGTGVLKPGLKLKITFVQSSLLKPNAGSSYEDRDPTKYTRLMYDLYLDGYLYKRSDEAPLIRFESWDFQNHGVYDFSKFFK